MKSIAYIPGSDGAANASLMTITAVRSSGATTIQTNTVANVPTKFYASMGTPHTFTDPVTGETITVVSEATAVDFAGHVDGTNIEIDEIAPGYTDSGSAVGDIIMVRPVTEWANNIHNVLNESHNDDGTLKDSAITYEPTVSDHVAEGGVWSTLSGLNATMTALTGYQGGHRGTIGAVASQAFTASKDTYIDVLRTTSGYTDSFSLVYTEVANGAAAPALAADSFRLAKVVTGASSISSITQSGVDSLNNPIYPNGSIGGKQLDSSDLTLNIKSGSNASTLTPTNSTQNLPSVAVTFTVPRPCRALVTVSLGIGSSSDFEFRPMIYLNGSSYKQMLPGAALSAASRAQVRGFTWAVDLVAGLNTISAGVFISAGTSINIPANAAMISALVLGEVTE